MTILVALIMGMTIHKFTSVSAHRVGQFIQLTTFASRIHHPFLLSDNRHYTFYVWRRVFLLHPVVPYLLIPGYIACAWTWFLRTGTCLQYRTSTDRVEKVFDLNDIKSAHRPGSNLTAEYYPPHLRGAHAGSYPSLGAAILPHPIYIAESTGGGRPTMGRHIGRFLVWCCKWGYYVYVPIQRAAWSR